MKSEKNIPITEKIILIHYLYVGGLTEKEVEHFMEKAAVNLTPKENNILSYFFPIKTGETRVECINPKLVSEEDFIEAKKVLDRNQEIVNNIIKSK